MLHPCVSKHNGCIAADAKALMQEQNDILSQTAALSDEPANNIVVSIPRDV